jgi:hypothetical protein
MLNNDGRCTVEIKSRIAMEKYPFNYKRVLFTGKVDLELREKLVKCYIWSGALYGAEIGTVWGVDRKQMESFKCGAGEGWRRSVGPIV